MALKDKLLYTHIYKLLLLLNISTWRSKTNYYIHIYKTSPITQYINMARMTDDIFSSSRKKPTNVVLTKLEISHDYFELVKLCDNSNRIFIDIDGKLATKKDNFEHFDRVICEKLQTLTDVSIMSS